MDEEFELTEHDRQVRLRLERELWIVTENARRGDLPPVDLQQTVGGDNHRERRSESDRQSD